MNILSLLFVRSLKPQTFPTLVFLSLTYLSINFTPCFFPPFSILFDTFICSVKTFSLAVFELKVNSIYAALLILSHCQQFAIQFPVVYLSTHSIAPDSEVANSGGIKLDWITSCGASMLNVGDTLWLQPAYKHSLLYLL